MPLHKLFVAQASLVGGSLFQINSVTLAAVTEPVQALGPARDIPLAVNAALFVCSVRHSEELHR